MTTTAITISKNELQTIIIGMENVVTEMYQVASYAPFLGVSADAIMTSINKNTKLIEALKSLAETGPLFEIKKTD